MSQLGQTDSWPYAGWPCAPARPLLIPDPVYAGTPTGDEERPNVSMEDGSRESATCMGGGPRDAAEISERHGG